MPFNALEARVLDHLDVPGMVGFLSELVRIRSLGGSETPAQEKVAAWMRTAGLDVDAWELDLNALRAHPAYCAEIHRTEGLGVVGGLGEGRGRKTLILNGHVDVVPEGDPAHWSFPPWSGRVENGRVLGRGALDMKGGLVAALFAAKAVRDAGVRLKGRLILESVIGEEDGGMGTLAAILRGYRGDGAVIMEPTGMAVCPSQAGALNFRVTVRGKAAHGCARTEGVSALEKLWLVHRELQTLESRRNDNCTDPLFQDYDLPFALSIGKVRGGEWASSVPDRVEIEGRYGLGPGEGVSEAREQFQGALHRAAEGDSWLREHPPELVWWGGHFLPAQAPIGNEVVPHLLGAFRDLFGSEPVQKGVTFGSDMRLLVHEAETPTVLFGPGDVRQAHAADESVSVSEVEQTARTLALMTLRFCGYEE